MDQDRSKTRRSRGTATVRGLLCAALAALLSFASAGAAVAATAEPLTERAAVERALAASPTLRAAVLDLRAAEAGVRSEETRYTPTLYATADGGHTETLGASSAGVQANRRDSAAAGAGVTIPTRWGTSIDVGVEGTFNQSERSQDPTAGGFGAVGSIWGAEARVVLTQPLLRGAGVDVGQADLRAARFERTGAAYGRTQSSSELLRDVLTAFWELWYAQEAVAVDQASLALAERQRDESAERAHSLGTVAETDVLRFESEAARLSANLARAEAERERRAHALAGLLALPPGEAGDLRADGAATPLVPAALPAGDVAEAAVRGSTELLALEAEIDRAREQVVVLDDARQPRLDLTASVGVGGLWTDDTFPGLGLPEGRPAVTALVGLRFELPLYSTQAESEMARAQYAIEAAEARLDARRQALAANVAAQAATLVAALRRVVLAERSEAVAARLAAAEAERLSLGLSTPLQVVEAREQRRSAALERLRAVVDSNAAAVAVAHETGTLLAQCATLPDGR